MRILASRHRFVPHYLHPILQTEGFACAVGIDEFVDFGGLFLFEVVGSGGTLIGCFVFRVRMIDLPVLRFTLSFDQLLAPSFESGLV